MKLAALALVQAAGLFPGPAAERINDQQVEVVAGAHLREEELLFFATELDRLTLTETLTAYGDPTDPLLPVGELARLLDLDLTVAPQVRRITGTLGEERRTVTIDFTVPIARIGGRNIILQPADAGFARSDIYIRAKVLEQILPLRFETNPEALTIKLVPSEKLPIQNRLERLARLRNLSTDPGSPEAALRVEVPYQLYTAPSFDVGLESGFNSRDARLSHRYDIRAAGDLLYSGMQAYVGSDEAGNPSAARLLFERRSVEGRLPFGATRISAGDVFTPALAIGPRSAAGRGISMSTAPLQQTSVFDTIDLRGELPIGYDVELYINDVLRSGQRTPVEGRYEFLRVPLVRGINVIRIVTYGPRGDRDEVVRVLNVGGGQLRRNETTFEIGLVQHQRSLLELRPREATFISSDFGAPRLVAGVAHGLTETLTLVAGLGLYSATEDTSRQLLSAGLRTSLAGFAVQADAAGDQGGGKGLTLGFAGQPLGISTLLRHSEYRDGFVDETINTGDFTRPLMRHTGLTLDMSLPLVAGKAIPLSLRFLRDGYEDGGVDWIGSGRLSTTIARVFVSKAIDFQRNSRLGAASQERLAGSFAASKFINFKWQLRGVADYEAIPDLQVRALSFTADRSISDRLALRFGLGQSLGEAKNTYTQAGAVLRLPFGELAFNGDYAVQQNEWRVGLRFGFGALFDPNRRRYVVTRPGPAAGGNAIIHAFIDHDGDGRFGPGDEPVPKVLLEGGGRKTVTGNDGRAIVTGLGTAPSGSLQADIRDIDKLYVTAPPGRIEFPPRPGQVLQIPYPLVPTGEVYARLSIQDDEKLLGLSAVRVLLVRDGSDPIEGTTEFDGSVVFSNVPLGEYRLELEPSQAERLKMRLSTPSSITVEADRPVEFEAEVEFEVRGKHAGPEANAAAPLTGLGEEK